MPYSGLGGMEVVDFLKSGQRLKQPDGCPDKMYFFSNFFSFMLIKDWVAFWRESLRNCFLLQQMWDNDVMLAFRPLTTPIIRRDCCLTGSSTASNKVVHCTTYDIIKLTVQRRHWNLPCAGEQELFSIPKWAQFSQASQRKTQKNKYFCPEKNSHCPPLLLTK